MNAQEILHGDVKPENKGSEGVGEIVRQLQILEKALTQFKKDQDDIRKLPERGEKNALLAEIEGSIRATSAMINELQSEKMELLESAGEKYNVVPVGETRTKGPVADGDLTTIRLNRD